MNALGLPVAENHLHVLRAVALTLNKLRSVNNFLVLSNGGDVLGA